MCSVSSASKKPVQGQGTGLVIRAGIRASFVAMRKNAEGEQRVYGFLSKSLHRVCSLQGRCRGDVKGVGVGETSEQSYDVDGT